VNEYIGVFILVFVAVMVALVVTGSLFNGKKPSFHVGLPDQ
jgi:hypothetical protein